MGRGLEQDSRGTLPGLYRLPLRSLNSDTHLTRAGIDLLLPNPSGLREGLRFLLLAQRRPYHESPKFTHID